MKKFVWLCFVLLALSACGGDDQGIETEIAVPVSVEEVRLRSIEEFVISTGTVSAGKEVLLKAEHEGYYRLFEHPGKGRPFALGDIAEENERIIRLDNPEVENNVAIESKKLNLETTRLEYENQQALYKKGGATLREVRNAEKSYIDAKYSYDNALITLAKLDVRAPFAGIIVDMAYYTPGTKVAAGSEMVQIMDYSRLHMKVNLPGKDMEVIAVDQQVRVTNYTIPDDTLQGRVTQFSPAIDPDTRSFKVAIEVENPGYLLRPGMFVKAEIIVARKDSTVVIPKNIILSKQRGKTVFIVQRGAAQERVIKTGLENPDEIEVLEGLKANDRLVVKGFETLLNRSKVKVIR